MTLKIRIRHKIIFFVIAIAAFSLTAAYISFHVTQSVKVAVFSYGLTALGSMAVFNVWLSRAVFSPFCEIIHWVNSIGAGDLTRRVAIPVGDEIGGLHEAMNEMSRRLQSYREGSVAEKSRLEAIFLSMVDGIMVLDRYGVIVLMNRTLRGFLGVDKEVAGKKPLEVIRHMDIQKVVENILTFSKRLESCEIIVDAPVERFLRLHAAPVLRDNIVDGVVLVFHDITELRRLEKIRQDFVANVSHELRTPVSTIRGYAETLIEGAMEDKAHAYKFLKIIYDDSDRLAKLINDLLDLSRIESGALKLKYEDLAAGPVIDRALIAMRQEAQKYSIQLKKEIPPDLPKVKMDEARIAQVLFNLLENAVKYNKRGGSVTVVARDLPQDVEISVTDTGMGIPEEDLPRIFERFYRVDKAHSRQLGGTGLGLSIVKHIIHAHQSKLTVESKLGYGSTFRFTLPKSI